MLARGLLLGVFALGLGLTLGARVAAADDCTRPTGPTGDALGYTYGAAPVASFGNASVLVWYTTTGPYAVNPATTRPDGVPDDVAEVAQVTSDALASYATMGYRAPVADTVNPACGDDGGDGRLDVYLVNMTGGDGTTVAESPRCATAGMATTCASYILAQANFAPLYTTASEGIHTVLPHETFHAVQNAYDAGIDRFWAEGTAQWAAKTLDPSLLDLERFLPAFFSDTSRSLDGASNGVAGSYLYGTAIWPVFLTQRHGNDLVRAILAQEGTTGGPALAATDTVLQTMQTTLASEFSTFATWNAVTGTRAEANNGYPEAATYPQVTLAEITSDGAQGITSGYASFYYHLALPVLSVISITTDATRNAAVVVPIVNGQTILEEATPLPSEQSFREAIIVVSGITSNKTDAPFTLASAPAPTHSLHIDDGGCAVGGTTSTGVIFALLVVALRRRRRPTTRTSAGARSGRALVPRSPAASRTIG